MTVATINVNNPIKPKPDPTGTSTFISWERLSLALEDMGLIRSNETIACFVVGEDGIDLRLGKSND